MIFLLHSSLVGYLSHVLKSQVLSGSHKRELANDTKHLCAWVADLHGGLGRGFLRQPSPCPEPQVAHDQHTTVFNRGWYNRETGRYWPMEAARDCKYLSLWVY